MRIISLLTDFGMEDWFVGAMKGVLLDRAPDCSIVDVTHGVPPGDVRAGAFALLAAARYFPAETIHVAVVDPGVGSGRRALLVSTERCSFLGPDNGVLSWALRQEQVTSIHRLTNRELFLPHVSQTFQGRDLFAPAAAHLATGTPVEAFGPAQSGYEKLPWPEVREISGVFHGEILYVDRFGNAITNLPNTLLAEGRPSSRASLVANDRRCPLRDFYQTVPPGEPVAVPGSTGFLEIAINGGHAAHVLKLSVGAAVVLSPSD